MTREEALKAITAFVENYACGSDLDGLREAIEALKDQRPHGEWKKEPLTENTAWYVCSVCGEKVCCYGNNFCPNCGADMRGEAE